MLRAEPEPDVEPDDPSDPVRWRCPICRVELRRPARQPGQPPVYCPDRDCRDYAAVLVTLARLRRRIAARAPSINHPKIMLRFREDWRALKPLTEDILP